MAFLKLNAPVRLAVGDAAALPAAQARGSEATMSIVSSPVVFAKDRRLDSSFFIAILGRHTARHIRLRPS